MNPERFRRIKELFQAASDLPPDKRQAFLADACAGDPALHEELESLLSAHDEDDDFLEIPPSLQEREVPEGQLALLAEGEQIGPYRILGEIGRGGMGVVYMAEDSRLERKIALKALAPAFLGDPKREQRLRLEAKAAASLSHRSIATVYALEEFEGRLYIASEYVDGRSLRAELEEGPLEIAEVLEVAAGVAQGLAAAHARGIVHRDLKPENIMRDRQGDVKILDFGLATLIPSAGSRRERLTESGTVLGTPSYMSPEQLTGKAVDPRSDIFSLGVLLYELACSVNPFEGKTPLSTIAKVMEADPAPISQYSAEAAPLEPILRKCIKKVPESRYQSIRELEHDLEELRCRLESAGDGSAFRSRLTDAGVSRELKPFWWVVHQICVMAFYGLMVFPVWQAKERIPGPWGLVVFFSVLACAAVNGTWRTHLLFTAQFNRRVLAHQIRKANPWMRRFDWAFTILLLSGALLVAPHSDAMAGLLTAVAAGYLVVFLVVEPTTTQSIL